jgi:muramoyltetrapeptide carboxypeptidase
MAGPVAKRIRIGVVAPASRIEPALAQRIQALATALYPDPGTAPEVLFHPQCFLSSGHFAGPDAERAEAFLEVANDARFDALWFARGGYGSCRIAHLVLPKLEPAAANKIYLGYSDAGTLMAALYAKGFTGIVHGPMPADFNRDGGREAVVRALRYLVERAPDTLEPIAAGGAKIAAFNMTVLSNLLGTPCEPDLSGHELLLEEVSEYLYRIDRTLCHLTGNASIRKVAGIRLGRCLDIPPNDREFGATEVEIAEHWCKVAGIPYLGRADIGHDADNKVVPFGAARVT